MEIYAVKLCSKIEKAYFDRLLHHISKEKQERIKRFLRWEDSHRGLLADVLCRTVICSRLGIGNEKINIVYNEFGKPLLADVSDFYFNVSHSGEWVVCAADIEPVGIDVEKVKPIEMEIAEHFFSEDECRELNKRNEAEKLLYFYDLWTLKESYMKALGKGLSMRLNSFTIKPGPTGIKVDNPGESHICFFKQYNIDSLYKLSVCASNNNFPDEVVTKEFDEVYEDMIEKCCKQIKA